MKSFDQDGGECYRKWHQTRLAHLLHLSGKPPRNLCIDELNLTVCYRYAEMLMRNTRINRYLAKYHPEELRQLKSLVEEFERICENPDSVMPRAR
jgi:hypothetical protein